MKIDIMENLSPGHFIKSFFDAIFLLIEYETLAISQYFKFQALMNEHDVLKHGFCTKTSRMSREKSGPFTSMNLLYRDFL